jgi:hypothetical protein
MVPHADFAIPVTQPLVVETDHDRPGGDGTIGGPVLALGWWVEQPGDSRQEGPPAGTLYLVADETQPRPVWVAQARLTGFRLVSY